MMAIGATALTELRLSIRNRWVLMGTAALMLLSIVLALLGSVPAGTLKASPFAVTSVSLTSLAVYLVPLLALLLAYDSIIGDIERGTMLLLFTYPITRTSLIAGKFLGHLVVLSLIVTIGFGAAAGLSTYFTTPNSDDLLIMARLLGSSILLGAVFLTLGYLASVVARDSAGAAAIAIAIWLTMVLVYDLALLGGLSADLLTEQFAWLLVINPGDSFRLLNLLGFDDLMLVNGIGGASQNLPIAPAGLVLFMSLWVVFPFILTCSLLWRREL